MAHFGLPGLHGPWSPFSQRFDAGLPASHETDVAGAVERAIFDETDYSLYALDLAEPNRPAFSRVSSRLITERKI